MNDSTTAFRRPGGVTAICLLLGWVGLGALANAFVIPSTFATGIASELLRAAPNVASWILTVAALAYAVTALLAAFGLWRLRNWGLKAFLAWVCAACGFMVAFLALVRLPADTPPSLGIAFLALLVFIFGGGWAYLRRVYARSNPSAL